MEKLSRRALLAFSSLPILSFGFPSALAQGGMGAEERKRAQEAAQMPGATPFPEPAALDSLSGLWDVIVVGSGMAGHCAALSAREAGAKRILMIDKAPVVGGHSALANGSIAFVDPKRELKQGLHDSVAMFLQDAESVGGEIDQTMARFMAESSASGLDWLEAQGVRFSPYIFQAYGGGRPRCITAFGNMGGRRYVTQLHERLRAQGITSRLLTRAVSLAKLPQGAFELVIVDERSDRRQKLRTKSLVLATGGFGANMGLRMRYNETLDPEVPTTADPYGLMRDPATGDGLYLAQSLGAAWVNMDAIVMLAYWGGRMLDYQGAELYIDSEGHRFVDETAGWSRIAAEIGKLPTRSMFVITDARSVKGTNVGAKISAGRIHRAASIAEMARGMDIPAYELQRTIRNYNEHARTKTPDEFGRRVFAQTIEEPPFYWGQERLMIHATLGGLKTDRSAHVKREDGSVIEGLFVAGEVAGGIWGRDRLGGTGLLQALVLGRAAGKSAAAFAAARA